MQTNNRHYELTTPSEVDNDLKLIPHNGGAADFRRFINEELRIYKHKMPDDRIHLAEDRIFYYRSHVYDDFAATNMQLALTTGRLEKVLDSLNQVRDDPDLSFQAPSCAFSNEVDLMTPVNLLMI